MKTTNIIFTGAMAAILLNCGVANAVATGPVVASKTYVDQLYRADGETLQAATRHDEATGYDYTVFSLKSDLTGIPGTPGADGKDAKIGIDPESANPRYIYSYHNDDESDRQNIIAVSALQGAAGQDGAAGATGAQGPQGETGAPGLSAYQIWLNAGNTGSEAEFIASLKGQAGQDGTNGTDGKSAYQIWLEAGNTGDEAAFIASLKGEDGAAGQNGTDGSNGLPIAIGIDPESANPRYIYWYYADGNTANYPATSDAAGATRIVDLALLQGATGLQGEQGETGAAGASAYEIWLAQEGNAGKSEAEFIASLKGEAGQDGTDGSNGLSAYEIWLAQEGNAGKSEADFIASLKGEAGQDGTNGSNGLSAYEIWLAQEGNAGKSVQDFLDSLKGAKGSDGDDGNDGREIQLAPGTADADQYKLYYRYSGDYNDCTGGVPGTDCGWAYLADLPKGETGQQGQQGNPGNDADPVVLSMGNQSDNQKILYWRYDSDSNRTCSTTNTAVMANTCGWTQLVNIDGLSGEYTAGAGINEAELAGGIIAVNYDPDTMELNVDGKLTAKTQLAAGSGIDINSGTISAKIDGTTIGVNADGRLEALAQVESGNYVDVTNGAVNLKGTTDGSLNNNLAYVDNDGNFVPMPITCTEPGECELPSPLGNNAPLPTE